MYEKYAGMAGARVPLLKQTKLTVNAAPEPARKGSALTITGQLTRPDWNSLTGTGEAASVRYPGQPVKLQFRQSGSSTYTTVKTVYTDANGYLKTTSIANAAGYWRWSYAGDSSVASVSAAGDGVVLK